MKKKRGAPLWKKIVVSVNLIAAVLLAAVIYQGYQKGFNGEMCREILAGKTYVQTEEFQNQASDAVYQAVAVMARESRLEENGAYDPDKIIRLRDYLNTQAVYDGMPESEKRNGICYRLGDLYQWSLKGVTIRNDVLWETYKPLFYGSIQEYANQCDEAYNELVNQLQQVLQELRQDVTAYEREQKSWAAEATNVRYALWNLGSGNLCTNVQELQKQDPAQEELEAYFKGFESYYIFDSRSMKVEQMNVGDYYSYNTHTLLTGWNAHLNGEYQIYVGIDTGFPVTDQIAARNQVYEDTKAELMPYARKLAVIACIWLATLIGTLYVLLTFLWKLSGILMENLNTAVRILLYFAGYVLVRVGIRMLPGDGATEKLLLLVWDLVILVILIMEGIQRQRVLDGVRRMAGGEENTRIQEQYLFRNNRQMAEAVNSLGDNLKTAMLEQMKSERMKADLITNVSHDLKTPLTSIINYVDLMKRERIDNPKAMEYLQVLDQKSQRLKQLTEDLVEASRASSGNVTLNIEKIDFRELLMQTSGEFEERFAVKGLTLVASYPDYPLYVEADGRRLWRIVENLYRNVEKYAMPNTRVYLNMAEENGMAAMSLKNISEQPLNISPEELTERFTRGDESRTTEGSGLGLSIAKDLTELQKGTFEIYLDGDLFKVTVALPAVT